MEEAKKMDDRKRSRGKKQLRGRNLWIFRLLLLLSAAGILLFGSLFLKEYREYRAADQEYASLREHIEVGTESGETEESAESGEKAESGESERPELKIDYAALQKVNPDFSAVLYFPALDLRYPIAAGKDNEDYMHRSFEGKSNAAGSIFLDAAASKDYSDLNTFVFGHNMKNGSMFGKLKLLLKDPGLASSNPYLYLCRPDGIRKYRIFSYFVTDVEDAVYRDVTEADYESYVERSLKRSAASEQAEIGIDFTEKPKLLTLSTCSGPGSAGKRLLVQAALVDQWQEGAVQ